MSVSVYNVLIGQLGASYTAFGYNGMTLLSLAAGPVPGDRSIQVRTDPAYNPVVSVEDAEGEMNRVRLRPGNNVIDTIGSCPTGVAVNDLDSIQAELEGQLLRMKGRFDYVSGSPSSILHIASGFRPQGDTVVEAVLVGPSALTITAASVGADGWMTLSGGGGPTSGYDVRVSGEWSVAP